MKEHFAFAHLALIGFITEFFASGSFDVYRFLGM